MSCREESIYARLVRSAQSTLELGTDSKTENITEVQAVGRENGRNCEVVVRVRLDNDTDPWSRTKHASIEWDEKDHFITSMSRQNKYYFDSVFGPTASQAQVYLYCCSPLLRSFFNGYNCCILAYGQTGAGKTFTMGSNSISMNDIQSYGILPRASQDVFDTVHCMEADGIPVDLHVSFVEVYNEELRDLLDDGTNATVSKGSLAKSIRVTEDPVSKAICVIGVTRVKVTSPHELMCCLTRGVASRITASNAINPNSSRSHAIFTLYMSKGSGDLLTTSKFHFVDLAGSERVKKTKAEGDRLKEGIHINTGLLALSNVINVLSSDSYRAQPSVHHVPYRDSKLTRILQDSLGGNSRTIMIACINASSNFTLETHNTIKYATRARNIQNVPVVNQNPHGTLVESYQRQIDDLTSQVALLRQKQEALLRTCSSADLFIKRMKQQTLGNEKHYSTLRQSYKQLCCRFELYLSNISHSKENRDISVETYHSDVHQHNTGTVDDSEEVKALRSLIATVDDQLQLWENYAAASCNTFSLVDHTDTGETVDEYPPIDTDKCSCEVRPTIVNHVNQHLEDRTIEQFIDATSPYGDLEKVALFAVSLRLSEKRDVPVVSAHRDHVFVYTTSTDSTRDDEIKKTQGTESTLCSRSLAQVCRTKRKKSDARRDVETMTRCSSSLCSDASVFGNNRYKIQRQEHSIDNGDTSHGEMELDSRYFCRYSQKAQPPSTNCNDERYQDYVEGRYASSTLDRIQQRLLRDVHLLSNIANSCCSSSGTALYHEVLNQENNVRSPQSDGKKTSTLKMDTPPCHLCAIMGRLCCVTVKGCQPGDVSCIASLESMLRGWGTYAAKCHSRDAFLSNIDCNTRNSRMLLVSIEDLKFLFPLLQNMTLALLAPNREASNGIHGGNVFQNAVHHLPRAGFLCNGQSSVRRSINDSCCSKITPSFPGHSPSFIHARPRNRLRFIPVTVFVSMHLQRSSPSFKSVLSQMRTRKRMCNTVPQHCAFGTTDSLDTNKPAVWYDRWVYKQPALAPEASCKRRGSDAMYLKVNSELMHSEKLPFSRSGGNPIRPMNSAKTKLTKSCLISRCKKTPKDSFMTYRKDKKSKRLFDVQKNTTIFSSLKSQPLSTNKTVTVDGVRFIRNYVSDDNTETTHQSTVHRIVHH